MIKSGRVIRIFNDQTLVVNLGSADGVEKGARMSIYAPPVEISDPETGTDLGVYHHPKANVQAETVAEKFSIAGPIPIRRAVKKPAAAANLWQQFQTEYQTERRHLNIDESDADPFPSGSAIRVGDPVYITVPDPPEEAKDASDADREAEPKSSPQGEE